MAKETIKSIIKTSIVTAFTIAVALIWKDVIQETISTILPPGKQLLSQFVAAFLATILAVLAIYFILKTESEVERIIRKAESKIKRKR